MLINDNDKLTIILKSIRKYHNGNDIYTIITQEVCQKIIALNTTTNTQEIYDTITECFDLYNVFIKEKNIDLPSIPDGAYDLVLVYLNNLLEELE